MNKTDGTTGNVRTLFQEFADRNCERLAAKEAGATADPAADPASEAETKPKKKKPAKVVPFPVVWVDPARACPNGVLRSALFGVLERGARRYMQVERIASVDGVEIFYTGVRLDQSDLDVWEAVLHLCRRQGMGEECQVTAYELLRTIGRNASGKNYQLLDVQLARLNATAVRIRTGRYSYEGSLIDGAVRDHVSKHYTLTLNPKLLPLFQRDQYTLIDWDVRRALVGKPLAQWLHGFYSSHAKPFPISIDKLRELSGSEISCSRDFKKKLAKALGELTKALEAHDQPFNYAFEGELVHVTRTPSSAQRRHLEKKPRKGPRKRSE